MQPDDLPRYEVLAIRYASVARVRQSNFLHPVDGDPDALMPLDFFVWLVRGGDQLLLVDTGFNELMRPAMYGSFHAMQVLRRDGKELPAQPSVVAGPLCESGDVFTQGDGGVVLPRALGEAQVGDLLVIHDTGAYGASMSSNYNTRPLAAEVLVDGAQSQLIRRRQTVEELLALEIGL